jgi:hypothetical protein
MGGLRSAFTALAGHGPRARLAERAAAYLGERLSSNYTVMARYVPRDGADEVPLVVIGPHGVLVCYQDHWYKRTGPGISHPLSDSPSNRARSNAARVKSDVASGGFIYTPVEAVVVLTRGQPDDVGSSCVPVVAGMDALVQHLQARTTRDSSNEHTQALVRALSAPIRLASV